MEDNIFYLIFCSLIIITINLAFKYINIFDMNMFSSDDAEKEKEKDMIDLYNENKYIGKWNKDLLDKIILSKKKSKEV